MTTQDLVAQFHAYLLTEKRVSNNTFLAYKRDIDQLIIYLDQSALSVAGLTKKQLGDFIKTLKDQGLTAKTLSRKISSFKIFFSFLAQSFKISDLGKSLIFPTIEKTLPSYLTEPEVERLLLAANADTTNKGIRNKVMLYMLYATGVRVSELVNLTVDQLQFDTGFVKIIGKGGKERMIPVPRNILELLRFYLDHVYYKLHPTLREQRTKKTMYLFAAVYDNQIKPLSRQSFWMALKKILSNAAITKNVSPHSLRHSLATHLLEKGADLRSLQMLLGHQSLATVQIYTHLGKSQVRKIYDKKHPRA